MISEILTVAGVALKMIDKYIDDPVRRAKARQEYIYRLKAMAKDILEERDVEKFNEKLMRFLDIVGDL